MGLCDSNSEPVASSNCSSRFSDQSGSNGKPNDLSDSPSKKRKIALDGTTSKNEYDVIAENDSEDDFFALIAAAKHNVSCPSVSDAPNISTVLTALCKSPQSKATSPCRRTDECSPKAVKNESIYKPHTKTIVPLLSPRVDPPFCSMSTTRDDLGREVRRGSEVETRSKENTRLALRSAYRPPSIPKQKFCLRLHFILGLQSLVHLCQTRPYLKSHLDPFMLKVFQTRHQLGLSEASISIIERIQATLKKNNNDQANGSSVSSRTGVERKVGEVNNPMQSLNPIVDARGTHALGNTDWTSSAVRNF